MSPSMREVLSATCLSLAATCSAQCSRAILQDATDRYVKTQTTGEATTSGFYSLYAPSMVYTENDNLVEVEYGVLSQPLKLDNNRSIHDTTLCRTFTELIITSPKHPYVIGTRMELTSAGKISKIESVVSDPGDWAFNATGYYYWNSMENWAPIPAEKRDSRAVIQAAGDAYFNRFNDANVTVPWGTPCARLEGGAYTAKPNSTANTCNVGVPSTIKVVNRRYVVDEEMGVVNIFLGFPGLDATKGDAPMPDSHTFRVNGGKITYIHTVSACVNAGCGQNGTAPPMRRRNRFSQRLL